MTTSVLFTIPNFMTAGSGRAMLNIIQRLDRERFSPAVCVLTKGGDLDREVDRLGVPLLEAAFTVPPKPYRGLPSRAWAAARVFRPYRFDLWHSFHYLDDYTEAIIARLAGARAWVYTKKNMNWHQRAWYVRTLLASRIAAQNRDMMRDFFHPWPFRRKTRLIPRGVDTERFRPMYKTVELRQELGIPMSATVVGCVANLLPVKGHPTLVEALSLVPDLRLVIAGKRLDEEYGKALEKRTLELGIKDRVHFMGHVSDVPAFLAGVDIFVLPTWGRWRMEGCPVALLEAMACGVPCVATDIPGSRDLIEHEKSGLVVRPEDASELAAALRALHGSSELRRSLGGAARKRVLEKFDITREVSAHESLYEEVLR